MIFKIEHIDLDIAQLALQNSFLDNNSKDEGKQYKFYNINSRNIKSASNRQFTI